MYCNTYIHTVYTVISLIFVNINIRGNDGFKDRQIRGQGFCLLLDKSLK